MEIKPGKLCALLLGVSTPGFSTAEAIDELETRLRLMDPEAEIETHHEQGRCTRRQLLAAIDAWIERATAHNHCVLYYFGHGGRVRFSELEPELAERVFTYLSCESEDRRFTGLLDLELSARIAALDRRCASVTTIIDACYSGTIIRSSSDDHEQTERRETVTRSSLLVVDDAPEWVVELLHSSAIHELAAESHPRVVRLAGASPRTEGHLAESAWSLRRGPRMGMFTAALLDTLAAAGDDWRRLSWDSLAHAVRQRVISAFRMEGQWIAQAGPRNRRIFSSESVELPRTIGYVETDHGCWIRAGALAGVEIGDRWAVADPLVDEQGRLRELARGTVDRVDLNRARLVLDQRVPTGGVQPASAFVVSLARPVPVYVNHGVELPLDSPWLCASERPVRHHVESDGDFVTLVDREGEWASVRFPSDDEGRAATLELLDDRARATRLLEGLERVAEAHPQTAPVDWQIGAGKHSITPDSKLAPGARIWVRLHNCKGGGEHWFASVILIDVIGRPWLLNASQPDGVELEPNDLEYVGRRPGSARSGLELDWPDHARIASGGRVRLLLLVSGRPIQLGHLVHVHPDAELAAFRMQGADSLTREQPLAPVPALSSQWRWASVCLHLQDQREQ